MFVLLGVLNLLRIFFLKGSKNPTHRWFLSSGVLSNSLILIVFWDFQTVVSREENLWFHVSLTLLNQTNQTFPQPFLLTANFHYWGNLHRRFKYHLSFLFNFCCSNASCMLLFPSCAKVKLPSEYGRCLFPHSYSNNFLLSVAQWTFPLEDKNTKKKDKNLFPGCFSCIFHKISQ